MGHAETKERILNAAKKEFADKGFDGARMGAIAKNAKANQALIHYYFKTKENLYEHVLKLLFTVEQKPDIVNFLDKHNLTPSERLYMEIYFLVNLYISPRDPDFERILLLQIGRGGIEKIISITKEFFISHFQALEKTLHMGIDSGEFETQDPIYEILELVLFSFTYESFRRHFKNSDWFAHIYGDGYTDRVFIFLVEHTFKALCPSGKKIIIPGVPDTLIKDADKIIDSLIKERLGGIDE
jgi:AcrR family transcriptional regulator